MILISLIKVNLIKAGTTEKNKSKKGRRARVTRQATERGLCGQGAEPLQGTEGSGGFSRFICLAHGLGLNRQPPQLPTLTSSLPCSRTNACKVGPNERHQGAEGALLPPDRSYSEQNTMQAGSEDE